MSDPLPPKLPILSWGILVRRLFLSALGCVLLLTVVRCIGLAGLLDEAILLYDLRFDPLVIEAGELRVEGPRVPTDPAAPFFVDPEDKLDLTTLPDPAFVMRKHEVVQVQGGVPQAFAYTELQAALKADPIRVDSAALSAFKHDHGAELFLGVGLASVLLGLLVHGGSLGMIVAFAGLLTARMAPIRGFGVMAWTRRAARVAVVLPPVWLGLELIGLSVATNPCLAVVVYPWLLSTLTLLDARRAIVRPDKSP